MRRLLLASLLILPFAAQAEEGDATRGAAVFRQCTVCHTPTAESRATGPGLLGVVGRRAASAEGFNYSPAMRGSDLTWTEENLDKYLTNPNQFIRGNRMAFAGVRNPQQRADLIAYLKTLQ